MERFVTRHGDRITGTLAGFDRLRFRGTLRSISYLKGMEQFLSAHSVLLKDFGRFAQGLSDRLKGHAAAVAIAAGRPVEYLASSQVSKEDRARAIAARDGIREGLICVLSCVEPCRSFTVRKDRAAKRLVLVSQERKCLHLYFYYLDREFGLMHVRLQTWLPFTIHICVNGREWLARRLTTARIGYTQVDNAFVALSDPERAQRLLEELTTRAWPRVLTTWARRVHPGVTAKSGLDLHGYYWSLDASEYATDVLFRDRAALQAIYPALVRHAIEQFGSPDVLRFLGRRTGPRSNGEVLSHLVRRVEGVRVKHWVEENSIKMYDKHGCVLRIETTINNPRRYTVRRAITQHGQRHVAWIPMRKGVSDIPRRVEVSRAANARYLDALSVVGEPCPSAQLLDPVSVRVVRAGRPYRALRPISPQDTPLLQAIVRGEFLLRGFCNADLRHVLLPGVEHDREARPRAAGRVTRLIRLLRAHRIVHKTARTHYYRVSPHGQTVIATALAFRARDVALLAAA
jgi:hypothetical protein